jgi:putative oxidoreductase
MWAKSIKEQTTMKSSRLTPYLLSALRIVAGALYIAHGTQKLFGVPGHAFHAPVLSFTLMTAAGVLETFGGTLMCLGLFTRPVAFVLSGQMAVAFFKQHYPQGPWPILNGGELAVLYCFLWLFFWSVGPGPISVDALRGRS